MRINIDGICRGDGRIYIKVLLLDAPLFENIRICSTADTKVELPCWFNLLNEKEEKKDGPYSVIITLPLFERGFQEISFLETSTATVLAKTTIAMTRAKWESRLNYRIRKKLCDEIRDSDNIGIYQRINFELFEAIHDGNDFILRFCIWMPEQADGKIDIKCLDDHMQPVKIDPVCLNDEARPTPLDDDVRLHEMQYSIRIPNSLKGLCLIATDLANPSLFGFFVIEQGLFCGLQNKGDAMTHNAQIDQKYEDWFQSHKAGIGELEKQRTVEFAENIRFSIIVPLYKTPIGLFDAMVASVLNQSYRNWELILINATPEDAILHEKVRSMALSDSRIIFQDLPTNLGITENTNAGIDIATGDFLCFFDHDDLLEPNALFEYAKSIDSNPKTDLLYCDEDKICQSGLHSDPFFKPDFNIDLLRSENYICHLLCIRKNIVDQLPRATSIYDGAQDHNMTLRAIEKARFIGHVPKILYHWRITENSTASHPDTKPYASAAGIRSVQEHLDRLGIPAQVSLSRRPFTYEVEYLLQSNPMVSIIIPNKDNKEMLAVCIRSIINKTTYDNYEIVIIENNSTDKNTFEYYDHIQKQSSKIRIIRWGEEFNFSKIINFGVANTHGDYLLLLNNDTELITANWLEKLLGLCARQDVGAVGVRMLYRDETIQHAGVLLEKQPGVAGHAYPHLPKSNLGYFGFADVTRDYSAVTAACMMTKRDVFDKVHGFTEKLGVAFNDIDYCLKIREEDLLIVYTPEVELFHYKSTSREKDSTKAKQIRFFRETSYMHYRWAQYYIEGDPQLNPNLLSPYMTLDFNKD